MPAAVRRGRTARVNLIASTTLCSAVAAMAGLAIPGMAQAQSAGGKGGDTSASGGNGNGQTVRAKAMGGAGGGVGMAGAKGGNGVNNPTYNLTLPGAGGGGGGAGAAGGAGGNGPGGAAGGAGGAAGTGSGGAGGAGGAATATGQAGGGGGGGGANALSSSAYGNGATSNVGVATGGNGGDGGSSDAGGGGGGGAGGNGFSGDYGGNGFQGSTIRGGAGGAGGVGGQSTGGGGAGGAGLYLASTGTVSLINSTAAGGTGGANGGAGGDGVDQVRGGLSLTGTTQLIGGTGGTNGGQGGHGFIGQGGTANQVTLTLGDTASVTGGNGGAGGGRGGDGIRASDTTITVGAGTSVTGGRGGATAAQGGYGITGANLVVSLGGTVTGGLSGDAAPGRSDALRFTGGTNTLNLAIGMTQGAVGAIGLSGTLNIDPVLASTTLASVIHDIDGNAPGALTKIGAGTLVLTGANTYSGLTTVATGTLELSGGQVLSPAGNVAVLAGALQLDASQTIGGLRGNGVVLLGQNNLLTLTGADPLNDFAGAIRGNGSLTVNGGAAQTLSGFSDFQGPTRVAGTLTLTRNGAIGNSNVIVQGGTFDISGITDAGTTINGLSGEGNPGSTVNLGAKTLTITNANPNTRADAVIQGTGGMTIASGTEVLSGTSTYSGASTINAGATLALQGPDGKIANSAVVADGTFDISRPAAGERPATVIDTTVTNLSGGTSGQVVLGGNTLILSRASGGFAGAITGTGGFTLNGGTQTFVLSGTGNTYSGATTIGDRITLQGSTATLSPNSAILLDSGGTLAFVQNAGGTFAQTISGTNGGIGKGRVIVSGLIGANGASNGQTLTLSGALETGAIYVTDASSLVLSGADQIEQGVTLASGSTLGVTNSLNYSVYGVSAYAGSTLNNSGQIVGRNPGLVAVVQYGASTLNNAAGAALTGVNAGVVSLAGTSTINNAGTIRAGTLANSSGGGIVVQNAGSAIITNSAGGIISGQGGISVDNAAGIVRINNAGQINGTGSQNAVFGIGVNSGTVTIANTNGIGVATYASGPGLNSIGVIGTGGTTYLANTGVINGTVAMALAGAATATVYNGQSGSISGTSASSIRTQDASALTLVNYGQVGAMTLLGTGGNVVSLRSGSITGAITGGAGADTVALYTGAVTNAPVVDAVTGLTLQSAGTRTAAAFGTIDLGGGANTLQLRGTGDGGNANGAAGTLNLASVSNIGTIAKLDAGTWTLTGAAGASAAGATILAGNGGAPGSGGLLVMQGSGLTGAIYVNGATVQATGTGTLGTGTIYMVDPQLVFATSSATYANNVVLQVARPGQGSPSDTTSDPSRFTANQGVVATLTGSITTGSGANANGYQIDPVQPVVIDGGGTVVLTNAANNWTGTTTIAAGTTLRGTTASVSGGTIVADGTLNYDQTVAGASMRAIAGAGVVQITNTGPVTLTGAITTQSGVRVGAGSTATLFNASGSAGNAVTFTGAGATLNVAPGGSVTTTNGNGIASTFANNTVTNAGTLAGAIAGVNLSANTGTNTVTNNGGTIRGGNAVASATTLTLVNTGTLTGTVGTGVFAQGGGSSVTNSGSITGGNGAATTAAVSLTGGGTVTNSAGGTIAGNRGVNISGGAGTITNAGAITGTSAATSAITFGTGGATLTNQAGGVVTAAQTNGAYGSAVLLAGTGNTVNLQAGSTVNGSIDGGATTGANAYTVGGALNGGLTAGTGADTVTVLTGASVAGTLDGGAGTDTLVLDGAGTGSLGSAQVVNVENGIKQGTGTFTLAGTTAASPTSFAVNAGTLAVAGGNALADTAAITIAAPGTLQLNANETIGSLAGAGNVALGANTLTTGGLNASPTFSGVIAGSGGLTKVGTGTLTLSGANTYTGATTINAGTLAVSGGNAIADTSAVTIAAPGTLQLNASETIGSLSGAGTVALGANTLTTGGLNANPTFSGVIAGSGGLTKVGTGTLTLSGANTYTGATTVNAGTLALGASNVLADTTAVAVANGATLALGANSDTVGSLVLAGTLAGTGTLTAASYVLNGGTVNANLGAGTLTQASGTSTLNGTSAATTVAINGGTLATGADERIADAAAVTIAAPGTLALGGNETIGSLAGAGNVALGANTLTTGGLNASPTFSGVIAGSGGLTKVGTGTLTLSGANTYTGATNVNAGTLALGASDVLADATAVAVANGATLDLGANSDTVGSLALAGTLAGTGTLTAATYVLNGATVNANLGAGTLTQASGTSTLNGTSAAGTVAINAGTLATGAAERIADNAAVTIASGAQLTLGGNETIGSLAGAGNVALAANTLTTGGLNASPTFSGVIAGSGGLTKVGTGTLTLSGANTYTGATTINAGTLAVSGGNAIADTSAVTIAAPGTLQLNASETIGSLSGAGTVALGANTLTTGGLNANPTFSGVIAGSGGLTKVGTGTLTLSGANTYTGATTVNAGTLALGASNVLADTTAVAVANGATLALGANSDTVGSLTLAGTLAGTGTLTAASYVLNGGTVNANLGAGTLTQASGTSTLNGTSAATTVAINAGTLATGAAERISDTAAVTIANGAQLTLGGNETIGSLAGAGNVALGANALTFGGLNTDTTYSGAATGTGDLVKVGTGTLTRIGNAATTARLVAAAGTVAFSGNSGGSARVAGGTLNGGGSFAGNLTLASGTLTPGTAAAPVGSFTVGSFASSGGTYAVDITGSGGGYTSDLIRAVGAATLTGGTVAPRATEATANYRLSQTYTIVTANTLTGTFANGTAFAAVGNNADLQYRLRYDLVPNAVLLELRRQIDFTAGLPAGATPNQVAVGTGLNGAAFTGSDSYIATLGAIANLSGADRQATYDLIGGEVTSAVTTEVMLGAERFNDLVRNRLADGNGLPAGADLSALGGDRSQALARAATLGDGASTLAGSADGDRVAVWLQGHGADGGVRGRNGTASVRTYAAGVVGGIELKLGGLTIGAGGLIDDLEAKLRTRQSRATGTLYQGGGYVAYDGDRVFANAIGSYFSADVDTERNVYVGTTRIGRALGEADTHGYTAGGAIGYRFGADTGLRLAPQLSGKYVSVTRDAYTETGAGDLSLAVAREKRDLFTATGELRLSHVAETAGGSVEPWASVGVQHNSGDRDAFATNRFVGAPVGSGTFAIRGAGLPEWAGLVGGGITAHPTDRVTLGASADSTLAARQKESRVTLHVRFGF